jgi:hypothetical protein
MKNLARLRKAPICTAMESISAIALARIRTPKTPSHRQAGLTSDVPAFLLVNQEGIRQNLCREGDGLSLAGVEVTAERGGEPRVGDNSTPQPTELQGTLD